MCRLDRTGSLYMSGSLDHDSLPSLPLLPAMTFDPTSPSRLFRLGRRAVAAGRPATERDVRLSAADCQRVSLSLKPMMPADLVFNRPCPPPCCNCQVHDQTSMEALFTSISSPYWNIGRFPLKHPVWASIQRKEFSSDLSCHLNTSQTPTFNSRGRTTRILHSKMCFSLWCLSFRLSLTPRPTCSIHDIATGLEPIRVCRTQTLRPRWVKLYDWTICTSSGSPVQPDDTDSSEHWRIQYFIRKDTRTVWPHVSHTVEHLLTSRWL